MLPLSKNVRGLAAGLALFLAAGQSAAGGAPDSARGPHVLPYPAYVIMGAEAALAPLEPDGVSDLAQARQAVRAASDDAYEIRARHGAPENAERYRERQDAVLDTFWQSLAGSLTHADYVQVRDAIWQSQGTRARFDPSYLAPEGVQDRPELKDARARAIAALLQAHSDLSGMFFASDEAMQDFVDARVHAAVATLDAPLTAAERERVGLADVRKDPD